MDGVEIYVPESTAWQPMAAATLMQALLDRTNSWISLDIFATSEQVKWVIVSGEENQLNIEQMQTLVASTYPGAVVTEAIVGRPPYPFHRRSSVMSFTEANFFETAISVHSMKSQDPLNLLALAMSQLEEGEVLSYQVLVESVITFSADQIESYLTASAHELGYRHPINNYYRMDLGELAGALAIKWFKDRKLKKHQLPIFDEADTQRYLNKLTQRLAVVSVYLRLDSPRRERLDGLSQVIAAVKNLTPQGLVRLGNGLNKTGRVSNDDQDNQTWPETMMREWEQNKNQQDEIRASGRSLVFLLTADELATLWHLPHAGFTSDRIAWVDNSHKPLPRSLQGITEGALLGWSGEHWVYLPTSERTSHVIVIGKTRVGKSSLIHNQIHSDIAAGRGLCLINPHRELTEDILAASIPDERLNDVILLDVANWIDGVFYPPPLNPLAAEAETLAATMLRVYDDLQGTRMERWLGLALKTLKADPQATIWDVQRIFEDEDYRVRLLKQLNSLALTRSWENYNKTRPGDRESSLNALFGRLDTFYTSDMLLSITCNQTPLRLADYLRDNKIILVSLGGEHTGVDEPERAIMGTALVSQIYALAMRGCIPEGSRPFMLYIDEAHFFRTAPLATILSEVGKKGLGLFLADQYLSQLADSTQQAMAGNAGTIISFEIGADDRAAMSAYMCPPFERDELTHLGKYKAAVSMRNPQGQRPEAFTLDTLPPPQPTDLVAGQARAALIRRRSAQQLGLKPMHEVLAQLAAKDRASATIEDHESNDDDFIQPFNQTPEA